MQAGCKMTILPVESEIVSTCARRRGDGPDALRPGPAEPRLRPEHPPEPRGGGPDSGRRDSDMKLNETKSKFNHAPEIRLTNFEFGALQKYVDYLQKSATIHARTSSPKFQFSCPPRQFLSFMLICRQRSRSPQS